MPSEKAIYFLSARQRHLYVDDYASYKALFGWTVRHY